ncbi:Niemann-Pick C1 protein [Pycnococcus provasolii]
MLAAIEGALQKSYAGFGRAVPGRFAIVTLAVAAVLLAVAGVGYVAVEKETDVFELWVDDTSRLKSELDFYDDNFGGSRTQSLIVTPKTKDVNLLTPEALDEVKEITRWFRDLQYKANVNGKEETITHADICSKAVETTNADPCFVFSPLDCFMEGRYAVVGEENNHVPWQGYDGRASAQCINHPNPALRTNLTYEYLRDRCRYFFNIKYPYHIVFGGPRWKDPATTELKHPWFRPEAVSEHGNLTLDSVKSFRLLFPTLDEKLLHEKGVRKVDFKQAQERDEDILTCPRAACENVPLHGNRTLGCDCTTCTRDGPENTWFNALVALKAKCQPIPTLATQHPECCAWMKSVREHPCVEHLWAWNAQAVQTGAYVLQQCGLPPVRPFIAVDRCKESKLAPNITTTTTMVTTTTATTPQAAPECWPSNPTEMCGSAALTAALVACVGGVANDACCGALKDNIGADSDKNSSRCFCYDAIVEGAKATLAQYNPTADLGAIIDTCNTDFGANVPYAGGTSSSSTCECAAPAPSAPECWPSNPTEMCGSAALTTPLVACVGGVANDACCGALKDNIGADSDKNSSRCFCYDAIVEGAKTSLAQYNPAADLGAIIDTCNTDFGANVPYAGGTSSSSTCSCAAPAPSAPECWPSNPTEMCGSAALTTPLVACVGGVANDACCGALKDNIGADSDKNSSRCFCYDAIVEGAKTSLAQYNPAADLGAIIDTCNTDFGANVPYAGGTSSSSTCECAAPAPSAPECWPSNPTDMCGSAALTTPLVACVGGVANDACCGALKDNIGADSDKNSSRCFCYDAIVEGAKTSLAQYNPAADLGAIIDTCNTDFGANVPYAGGTSSSSTCECAAPAPECWPSNPTEMCGSEALTAALVACVGGVANDACCGALKDNIGADSDKNSSRCFCYDAIVEGAKTSLAQYNPTADLGAIIDTCNTDFGANVPYAGGTSSSSTCSCAAPAPTTSTTTMTTTKPDFCSSPAYPLGGKSDTVSTTLKVASEKEAYDILYGWENLWTKSISAELANSTKYKHIKVSYLSGSSVEDTIKDASNSQIPLLVLGYGLVIVYTVSLFLPFNPLAQRPDVGVVPPGPLAAVAVVCFIALSTWGALGIAGAISTGDVKFNALTLQVVPFLALGLGVNDFLVLAQSLSTCYAERPLEADATSIIAETMRHGGVSVTLSSVTNTFAFLLGMLSGIPAVRAFALHIALAELFNFLLTLFVFPSILFLETRRFLAMDKEQGKAAPAPGAGKEVTESRAKKIVDFFNTPLGMAVRVFLAVLSVALLIFCAFGIPDVKVGLRLTDVIPKGKPLHKYAVDVEDVYCTSPVYLTYRGMDFEKIVEDSLNLNYEFVKDGHNMDFIYEVTSQYNYYLEFIEGQLQSDEVCTWEVTYVKDPWRETINTCEGKTSAACEADCKSRNTEGAQKAAPADKKCKYSNETNTCYCPYRPMLKPEYFYNISTDVKLDEADHREETESGTNIRILDKFFDGPVNGRVSKFLTGQAYDRISAANDTYGKLTAARTLTFAENMCSYDERIKHIKRGREIADASSLNAKGISPGGKMKNVFPFDWIVYALTEQYLHIEHQTLIALVICCITIFVVMMPFVVHPATSLLVTSVIVKILAELYGLIFWTGLKLNAVTMINLLISVGVAVELTAHVGREFMVSQGTRLERAVKAASDMAWPLTNGALSTFIGIIAIAFSDYEYFRNYFFMQYLLILVISLWNGLVFLPSLLSVVGPPAYNAGDGAGSSAGKDPEQGKSDKA